MATPRKTFKSTSEKFSDFILRKVPAEGDEFVESLASHMKDFLLRCESPIEKLLGAALYLAEWRVSPDPLPFQQVRFGKAFPCIPLDGWDHQLFSTTCQETIVISPQHKIGNYRVDFLIVYHDNFLGNQKEPVKIVVECDGFDFHERTKEQASRDRARDRDLQSKGFFVLRFTGSDIHRDACHCADQVVEFAAGMWRRNGQVA